MPVKYELVEAPDNFWAIKILEGELAGVIYRYGTIKALGEDENENMVINFEFDVLDPGFLERDDIKGPGVDKIMGEILQEIILESINKESDEHNRKTDSKEPDSQ